MQQSANITLSLDGPRGRVELSDFANAVNALRNALKNVWRCATGSEDVEYEITDLKPGSAMIAASPPVEMGEIGKLVAELFAETILALQNDMPLDPRIDYQAIHAFNGFSNIARKQDTILRIGEQRLSEQYAARVGHLLEPDSTSHGCVTGRLEGVSIHGGNRFALYPPLRGEHVECIFAGSALPEVLAALGKTATVHGTLHYAKTKTFPVRVEVESFEVLPDERLPTLLSACGITRGAAVSSIEAVREMRNDWR